MYTTSGSSNNTNSTPNIVCTLPTGAIGANILDVSVDNGVVQSLNFGSNQVNVTVANGGGHSVQTGTTTTTTPHSYSSSYSPSTEYNIVNSYCQCPSSASWTDSSQGTLANCSGPYNGTSIGTGDGVHCYCQFNGTCSYNTSTTSPTYSTYYAYNVTVKYSTAESRNYHVYKIGGRGHGILP